MNGVMPGTPNPILAQLDDIKGLDKISWWPLAPGWWAVLALAMLAAVAGAVVYLHRRAHERSWKGEAEKELRVLDKRLDDKNAQEVLSVLSVTLRRIAMQRFSRAACAGLEGQDWLQWLTMKDPHGFNWTDQGALLTETTYAPPGRILSVAAIKTLLHAAKEWVR